jgi:hypothetical protein
MCQYHPHNRNVRLDLGPGLIWAPRCITCWVEVAQRWPEEHIAQLSQEDSRSQLRLLPEKIRQYLQENPEIGLEI